MHMFELAQMIDFETYLSIISYFSIFTSMLGFVANILILTFGILRRNHYRLNRTLLLSISIVISITGQISVIGLSNTIPFLNSFLIFCIFIIVSASFFIAYGLSNLKWHGKFIVVAGVLVILASILNYYFVWFQIEHPPSQLIQVKSLVIAYLILLYSCILLISTYYALLLVYAIKIKDRLFIIAAILFISGYLLSVVFYYYIMPFLFQSVE